MKGIKTGVDFDHTSFATETEYKTLIEGKWYKVTCVESELRDRGNADSDNLEKWDVVGTQSRFKIVPTENPEQDLPKDVVDFIRHFCVTGEGEAILGPDRQW